MRRRCGRSRSSCASCFGARRCRRRRAAARRARRAAAAVARLAGEPCSAGRYRAGASRRRAARSCSTTPAQASIASSTRSRARFRCAPSTRRACWCSTTCTAPTRIRSSCCTTSSTRSRASACSCSRRSAPKPCAAPWAQLLSDACSAIATAQRVALERLGEADVAAYVSALLDDTSGALSRAVFEKSEGNPFFMAELVAATGGRARGAGQARPARSRARADAPAHGRARRRHARRAVVRRGGRAQLRAVVVASRRPNATA